MSNGVNKACNAIGKIDAHVQSKLEMLESVGILSDHDASMLKATATEACLFLVRLMRQMETINSDAGDQITLPAVATVHDYAFNILLQRFNSEHTRN